LIVKYLQEIPVAQIVFMRSIVMFVMVVFLLSKRKLQPFGNNKKLLILRGIFGTTGIAFFFYTLHQMPLASAVVVHYLTPIITVLISVLVSRVNVKAVQWLFFGLCFTGIFIIKGFDERIDSLPLIIGILGTIGAASAYNIIAVLKQTEHHLVIMFYFPLVTIPLVLIYIFITGDWVWASNQEWALLSVIGILTYFAQYFLTKAYQIGDVSKVSVISYLGVVYALVFGYYLFDEWYEPIVVVGLFLVVAGVLGNLLTRTKTIQ
ncbi:MAG: DMT family transporter, partial [Bacteroidia bacterium]|nr:DMT family transporter [Bacteroidia bacterium]